MPLLGKSQKTLNKNYNKIKFIFGYLGVLRRIIANIVKGINCYKRKNRKKIKISIYKLFRIMNYQELELGIHKWGEKLAHYSFLISVKLAKILC